jgi:hypothetical protein
LFYQWEFLVLLQLTPQVSERRRIKLSEELILLVMVSSLEEVSMGLQDGLYEEISSLCSEGDL